MSYGASSHECSCHQRGHCCRDQGKTSSIDSARLRLSAWRQSITPCLTDKYNRRYDCVSGLWTFTAYEHIELQPETLSRPSWHCGSHSSVLGSGGSRSWLNPSSVVVVTTFETLIAPGASGVAKRIMVHKGRPSTRHAYALDTADLET